MLAYWLLFGMWTLGAIQFARKPEKGRQDRLAFIFAALLTALMIGLRYQVGGDWFNYQRIYNSIYFQPLPIAVTLSEPGYAALNWMAARFDAGIWPVNLVCGALFMLGLGRLALRQPNPWLAMVIAVPYFVIVVAMGYTRQAAAIGILCFAIVDASPTKIVRTVALVACAALFHKTALLMLPLLLLPVATRNLLIGAIGVVAFTALFSLVLGTSTDRLVNNYATGNYDAQGAAIRVGMNVVAAALYILLRKRMELTDFQRSFWTYVSIAALASLPALLSLSASTGVDRLSLFLIPLQIVTYSRLPYALTSERRASPPAIFALIVYSFSIQFIWLNYANNANAWIPYSTVTTFSQV